MKRDEFPAIALPKGKVGIEVGVDDGLFSEALLKGAEPDKLYLFDCWLQQGGPDDPGSPYTYEQCERKFLAVTERYCDNPVVEVVRATSPQDVGMFEDGFFDWVYLDANHSYKSVSEDLAAWYPKLKVGGVFAGHDYINEGYGLQAKRAVDEFLLLIGAVLSHLSDEKYADWAFIKPGG